jgi:hypothetical protein
LHPALWEAGTGRALPVRFRNRLNRPVGHNSPNHLRPKPDSLPAKAVFTAVPGRLHNGSPFARLASQLDEATSSVDYKTDQRIQSTIRDGFRASTVITIAHRLHTIADSDRIMCLDFGQLINFDAPAALLADATSVYAQLVSKGGTLQAPGAAPASAE